jgi:hypothetical protein
MPKKEIRTDLRKLDAHRIRPEEYEDAPELSDEQLERAKLESGKAANK